MIRPAVAADGPAIARVQRRTWQATYGGILPDDVLDGYDEATAGANWARVAEAPQSGSALFVAELDGAVVGFAAVAPVDGEAGVGEVEAIYVEPERQGAGFGRGLLDAAVASLAGAGYGEAILWVAEANGGARGFYEAFGWSHDSGARLWRGAPVVRYRRSL